MHLNVVLGGVCFLVVSQKGQSVDKGLKLNIVARIKKKTNKYAKQ